MKALLKLAACLSVVLLVAGCATPKRAAQDYTAFKQSKPRSILVLPPLNESPDVAASYGMLSQMTFPLAEAGYYVLPVALVNETFKQNGLSLPAEMHDASPAKLKDIFGADAALYVTVTKYGTSYVVLDSITTVAAKARLVDLRTGDVLWTGSASAASNEQSNNASNGLLGMLITAAIKQIANNVTDATFPIAGLASVRMLSAGGPNGLLYGPHSPKYGTD
ncbi:DUF799 domain-containing protein [Jeongeupia naejangsanensis]|uniref:DUF799 domain-containing protein n=1 Tax=Jeongeupia naejangsanensis TaxID=613195 RepID=A0ABS2BIF7_9NEIS|nr:DUF799 domain-containing protein [Jeongeupia naejangsanensis]MBM3114878.1 DUF799 domain-containing protein [Jeongeupia naejangsanensis]